MKGNTVSITGNITRDAEVKELASGSVALNFGICWNSSKKDSSGAWVEVPNFFNVRCYMTQRQWAAKQHDGYAKGARVAIIDGHLAYRQWEKDGKKGSSIEIVVDDPINGLMAVSKGGAVENGYNYASGSNRASEQPSSIYDDDIPF